MDLIDALTQTHALRLQTQLAHWNITGPNFIALHELLGEQYDEMGQGMDMLAERHRHLGHVVPAKALAAIEPTVRGEWTQMVDTLVKGHEALLDSLHQLESASAELGDPGTADLATERIRSHHEQAWKLRAHLG